MKKIFICFAVILCISIPCCFAAVPEGISVTGYSDTQDYLTLMRECAAQNTTHSRTMGSIYESQRNLKIKTENLPFSETSFFDSRFSNENIVTLIDRYAMGKEYKYYYSDADALMIAKVMYLEARGIKSKTQLSCIAWTILNRVDAGYGSISRVITAPNQFAYYATARTVNDYGINLVDLAKDVLQRWNDEKNGLQNVGRTLPRGYMWYAGDGMANYFRNKASGGTRWNYAWGSPYES